VADRQGITVTVNLKAEDLQIYERFQAALLRETGSSFRYLPIESLPVPTQAPSAPEQSGAVATREKSAPVGEFSIGLDPDQVDVTRATAFKLHRTLSQARRVKPS
jgi:hypothetical protein